MADNTYSLSSSFFVHILSGNRAANNSEKHVNKMKTTYTPYPPNKLYSAEKAKRDVDMAGPIARAMDTVVWESPFVAPSERLFGADDVTNIKMHEKAMSTIIDSKIRAINAIQTGGDNPPHLAKTLMMGNRAYTGKKVTIPETNTRFGPQRLTAMGKINTWNIPSKKPHDPRTRPIAGGDRPSPPNSMGVEKKSG